jgi:nucleoside-diphosphate-sugar epimerase
MKALIGHTGFVGSTLLRQQHFEARFRSTDIDTIARRTFDVVICAGAPAQKWVAEREPEADKANIKQLADLLETVKADVFVLVSTVDVFTDSRGATEDAPIEQERLSAYGRNRRWLELFVERTFRDHLIVRLPGLVGPGLRKNAVFDLHNKNNLHLIDKRAGYQFYPMVNLSSDLEIARRARLKLVHFAAEPLTVAEIARQGFGIEFENYIEGRVLPHYDLRSRHDRVFGGRDGWLYSRRESLTAIRAYAQSEPQSAPIA